MHFMGEKKLRKISGFVIYSYLKDNAFTAVKRNASYVKDALYLFIIIIIIIIIIIYFYSLFSYQII